MTGKRKPRKPRDSYSMGWSIVAEIYPDSGKEASYANVHAGAVTAEEARRLAAWLLRFADWADSKGKK